MSPEDLVGSNARVRIFSGAVSCGNVVMAEGVVVAYLARPSLLIRHDDGSQSSWSVDLPRIVVGEVEA